MYYVCFISRKPAGRLGLVVGREWSEIYGGGELTQCRGELCGNGNPCLHLLGWTLAEELLTMLLKEWAGKKDLPKTCHPTPKEGKVFQTSDLMTLLHTDASLRWWIVTRTQIPGIIVHIQMHNMQSWGPSARERERASERVKLENFYNFLHIMNHFYIFFRLYFLVSLLWIGQHKLWCLYLYRSRAWRPPPIDVVI